MERERPCSNAVAVTPARNDLLPPPMKHPSSSLITASAALLLIGSLATSARAATMILHSFIGGAGDGASPWGSLTLSDSKLYGMTYVGGSSNSGALFGMNTDGTGFGLLHNFARNVSDGSYPTPSSAAREA